MAIAAGCGKEFSRALILIDCSPILPYCGKTLCCLPDTHPRVIVQQGRPPGYQEPVGYQEPAGYQEPVGYHEPAAQ